METKTVNLFALYFLTFIIYICIVFRGLFIIDDKGILRQITMNDLPVSKI